MPKRPSPDQVRVAFIYSVPAEEATGELAQAYDEVRSQRGDIANIFQAMSLRPDVVRAHLNFYVPLMYGDSGLTRAERETLAVVVSAANNCSYCVLHHSDALGKYEKDREIIARLGKGEIPEKLPPRAAALARYARKLTKQSFAIEESDIKALRDVGFNDADILTANLIAAYYNMINRFVDGLGVTMESEPRFYRY